MMRHRQLLLAAVGIALVLCVAYSNHFNNPFTFDDGHTITDNAYIQDIKNVPLFFTDIKYFGTRPDNRTYRPMLVTLNAIDYWIGKGLKQRYFHVDIFMSYLVLLALLFVMFQKIFQITEPESHLALLALLIVAFYGLHTANAETINYIIMRSDSFSTLCMVAALVLYQNETTRKWLVYLVAMVVGMLTKESAVMFAPILFFYVLLFEEQVSLPDLFTLKNPRGILRSLMKSGPAVAVSVGFLVLRTHLVPGGNPLGGGGDSRWNYFYTQWVVIVHYLGNFILPLDLSADPDFTVYPSVLNQHVLLCLIVLLVMVGVAFTASTRRRSYPIAFGILWYFVSLAPTSSFFPFAQIANDHRTFLPNIGLVLSLGWWLRLTYEKWEGRVRDRVLLARAGTAMCVAILLLHAYGTYQRNIVWSSDARLWADAAKKSPNNGRALMNYGLTLMAKGDLKGTEPYFRRALELMPTWAYIHINMGILRNAMGFPDEAEQYFKDAIRYQPDVVEGYYYYARWLDERNRKDEALKWVDTGLSVSPAHLRLQEMRASLMTEVAKSIPELEKAVARAPTPESYVDLSLAYYQAGRYQECIAACEKAVALKPDYALPYNNMCSAYNSLGQWDKAIAACARAVELEPSYQLARNNLKWATDEKAKHAAGKTQ